MPEVRLAEAVAALSLAIDLGMGQPLEQGLRTSLIATELARRCGLDGDDVRRVFYLALLRHVGCTAESDTAAYYLGDEIAFRRGAITLDFTRPTAMLPYVLRTVGATSTGSWPARSTCTSTSSRSSASSGCCPCRRRPDRRGAGAGPGRAEVWTSTHLWRGKTGELPRCLGGC